MNNEVIKPKISIGLPVYNGEKFLKERLESILNQTFEDYELIISDNCSIDNTEKICKSCEDKRIKFWKQDKNIGPQKNFKFVLDQAAGEYFVWVGVDDLWEETFLEKNITYLKNNDQYVGSISKVVKYGKDTRTFSITTKDNILLKKYKNIRQTFRPFQIFSLDGNYQERIKKFLENPSALIIYAVFRTEIIKKCMVSEKIAAPDYKIILELLELGEINVLDEILLRYHTEGLSSKGLINQYKNGHIPLEDVIFPYFNFINWAKKEFGIKFMLSNSRFFLMLIGGVISNIREFFSK